MPRRRRAVTDNAQAVEDLTPIRLRAPLGTSKRLQMTRSVSQLMQQNFFLRVSFAAPRVLFVGCYYFGDDDGKTSFQRWGFVERQRTQDPEEAREHRNGSASGKGSGPHGRRSPAESDAHWYFVPQEPKSSCQEEINSPDVPKTLAVRPTPAGVKRNLRRSSPDGSAAIPSPSRLEARAPPGWLVLPRRSERPYYPKPPTIARNPVSKLSSKSISWVRNSCIAWICSYATQPTV